MQFTYVFVKEAKETGTGCSILYRSSSIRTLMRRIPSLVESGRFLTKFVLSPSLFSVLLGFVSILRSDIKDEEDADDRDESGRSLSAEEAPLSSTNPIKL